MLVKSSTVRTLSLSLARCLIWLVFEVHLAQSKGPASVRTKSLSVRHENRSPRSDGVAADPSTIDARLLVGLGAKHCISQQEYSTVARHDCSRQLPVEGPGDEWSIRNTYPMDCVALCNHPVVVGRLT